MAPVGGMRWSTIIYPLCLLILGGVYLNNYLADSIPSLVAGMAAIVSTTISVPVKNHCRYATAAVAMLILTWMVPVSTLLFFALGFLSFYWAERQGYRIHFLGLVALILLSPAFRYAANVFSFPIRLQLTTMAGAVFSLFATHVVTKGNTIFYDGQEFSVDPACMGLHMLSLSLLLGILLLGLLQRKAKKQISLGAAIFFLLSLFLLNLTGNLLRIVLLVLFAVPPDAAMHDVIGLLCLLLYVCMPACYLARHLVSKARGISMEKTDMQKPDTRLAWALLAVTMMMAQRVNTVDTYAMFNSKYVQSVAGFTSSVYAPGIVKLQNDRSLIYVKFIRGFYDTEHNPAMCWKGSGYAFNEMKKQTLSEQEVYTATLCRGNEKLYTAWWYGNDSHATTSQWNWRWDMLKGAKGYAVINVTAASKEALTEEIKKVLAEHLLSPLLRSL